MYLRWWEFSQGVCGPTTGARLGPVHTPLHYNLHDRPVHVCTQPVAAAHTTCYDRITTQLPGDDHSSTWTSTSFCTSAGLITIYTCNTYSTAIFVAHQAAIYHRTDLAIIKKTHIIRALYKRCVEASSGLLCSKMLKQFWSQFLLNSKHTNIIYCNISMALSINVELFTPLCPHVKMEGFREL